MLRNMSKQTTPESMALAISEARAHLGAALLQSIPSEDRLIMDHVRAAHAALMDCGVQEPIAPKPSAPVVSPIAVAHLDQQERTHYRAGGNKRCVCGATMGEHGLDEACPPRSAVAGPGVPCSLAWREMPGADHTEACHVCRRARQAKCDAGRASQDRIPGVDTPLSDLSDGELADLSRDCGREIRR